MSKGTNERGKGKRSRTARISKNRWRLHDVTKRDRNNSFAVARLRPVCTCIVGRETSRLLFWIRSLYENGGLNKKREQRSKNGRVSTRFFFGKRACAVTDYRLPYVGRERLRRKLLAHKINTTFAACRVRFSGRNDRQTSVMRGCLCCLIILKKKNVSVLFTTRARTRTRNMDYTCP